MLKREARPCWQADGRAVGRDEISAHSDSMPPAAARQAVLLYHGRAIAKLAFARPLGELVLAMPYRHRQTVGHVSVPPAVLAYARKAGCRWWVVRLDGEGRCLALPLAEVESAGWLRRHRDGHAEWFVELARFRPVGWQEWRYIERSVVLDDAEPTLPAARQLALLGGAL